MWVVALYTKSKLVEDVCLAEIHSRGPSYYLQIEEEKLLAPIVAETLIEQLTGSMRRYSICSIDSTSSNTAACGKSPAETHDGMKR